MRKNVIALLLSIALASSSITAVPVLATEMTVEEVVLGQEESIEEQEVYEQTDETGTGLIAEDVSEEEIAQVVEELTEQSADITAEEGVLSDEQDESADIAETVGVTVEDEEEFIDSSDAGDTSAENDEIEDADIIEEEIVTATIKEAAKVVTSGECGDNATWKLEGASDSLTLTISGNGLMYNYYRKHPSASPWYSRRNSISKIIINKGITSIGNCAFYGCSNLTTIAIPESVKSIGKNAFTRCTSLTDITIPDGVVTLGDGAFGGCSSLTSIKIPEGVVQTNMFLFSGCSSLTNVTFPSTLNAVLYESFFDCTSLKNVVLPIGVTFIDENAFSGCNLMNVTIPNTVTYIGNEAFGNGKDLNVFFIGSKEQWDEVDTVQWHDYSTISFLLVSNTFSVDADFQLPKTAYNYTGNQVKPSVTVTYDDKELVEGKDYELTYENNINMGMATVNVNGIGSYSGTAKLQFRIRLGNPPKVTCTNLADNMKVEWEKVSGATQYKVYRDDTLIATTSRLVTWDYDVKYDVGKKFTYKVIAYAKGYGDSDLAKTCTYYRLLPVGIKSLTSPSAGKMTVTYDKCEGSSGYVVQFWYKNDKSDAKVITVSGANTLSRTFSNLTKGKTYNVQVRTYKLVDGKRYYSTYSRIKTVTIKK